jgi:hypothetical protein
MMDMEQMNQAQLHDHCRDRCEQLSGSPEFSYARNNDGRWDALQTHFIAERIASELSPAVRERISINTIASIVRTTLPVADNSNRGTLLS